MERYIITFRKKHTDKDAIQDGEFWGQSNATYHALMMFNRLQLDRVVVVMVNTEIDMVKTVYLQERNCKHINVQQEFAGYPLTPINKCMDCGETLIEVKGEECMKSN